MKNHINPHLIPAIFVAQVTMVSKTQKTPAAFSPRCNCRAQRHGQVRGPMVYSLVWPSTSLKMTKVIAS